MIGFWAKNGPLVISRRSTMLIYILKMEGIIFSLKQNGVLSDSALLGSLSFAVPLLRLHIQPDRRFFPLRNSSSPLQGVLQVFNDYHGQLDLSGTRGTFLRALRSLLGYP